MELPLKYKGFTFTKAPHDNQGIRVLNDAGNAIGTWDEIHVPWLKDQIDKGAGKFKRTSEVFESAAPALSFTEKRTLQKTVSTNLAALAAGKVSFTDKRRLQKEITEAMAKLNTVVEVEPEVVIPPVGADVQKMKDAVTSYGGELVDYDTETVIFKQPGNESTAVLEYRDGGYRVRFHDKGTKLTGSYSNPDDAVGEYYGKPKTAINQNLADLQAGKFDTLDPLAFLGKLKEIADEINDIEPLKGPAISYIEKNSDKVTAIMESAMQEAFGKLWSAGAGA